MHPSSTHRLSVCCFPRAFVAPKRISFGKYSIPRVPSAKPAFLRNPNIKYYLHPSDSDGCRLVLNNFFRAGNCCFVEVKCAFSLKLGHGESQARGPFRWVLQNCQKTRCNQTINLGFVFGLDCPSGRTAYKCNPILGCILVVYTDVIKGYSAFVFASILLRR